MPTRDARDAGVDPTTWETWWGYEREFFLDVRRRIDETVQKRVIDGALPAGLLGARPDRAQIAAVAAPALRCALAHESNPDLLGATLIAVARLEGPTTGPLADWDLGLDDDIAARVADAQTAVSEAATIALGIRAREDGVRELADLLGDTERGRKLCGRDEVPQRLRAFAAYALGLASERTTSEDLRCFCVHALSRVLGQESASLRDLQDACVSALGLARIEGGVKLFERIESSRREILDYARPLPASAARAALVADLCSVLADESRPLQTRAQVPTAIAHVVDAGIDTDESLRAESLREILRTLARLHERPEVRQGCLLALGTLARPLDTPHDRDARAALATAVRSSDRAAHGFALISAGRIGAAARSIEEAPAAAEMQRLLLDDLVHARSGSLGWAALGLGILRDAHGNLDPRAADTELRRILESRAPETDRTAAALALGLRRDATDWRKMAEGALGERSAGHSADPRVRALYALALGLSQACEAGPTLRAVAAGAVHEPALLRDAAIGLVLLDDRALAPTLGEHLVRADGATSEVAFAEALAQVGDARSLGPLTRILGAKSATVGARTYSARALGAVGDLDSLSWNASYALDVQYLAASDTLTTATGGGILDWH